MAKTPYLKNSWSTELLRRDKAAKTPGYKPESDRLLRTPRWVHESSDLKESMRDIQKMSSKTGKELDHGIPVLNRTNASGLDVPQNASPLDRIANVKKSNKVAPDFDDFEWDIGEKSGRMNGKRWVDAKGNPIRGAMEGDKYITSRAMASRQPGSKRVQVPRAQGGFIDPKFLKGLGKVGLKVAATMALDYIAPNNPVAQARDRGYKLTNQLGGLLGVGGIEEGINAIENPYLKGAAHLGNGLIADPLLTAAGAGANMGDRLYNEIQGTNKKADIKRKGSGLAGRLPRGILDGA